jgi:hypothetical protein
MFIRDTNANFFIIFGGLYSRRCVESRLLGGAAPPISAALQSALQDIFDLMNSGTRIREVSRLQPYIKKAIEAAGDWEVERIGRTGDLLCKSGSQSLLIETKVQDQDRLDEAKGSGVDFAEDQLLRDLEERGINWGLLTNGWSWRLYNLKLPGEMIEFSIHDLIRHGRPANEMSLFGDIISPKTTREDLLKESSIAKKLSTNALLKRLRTSFLQLLESGWDRHVAVRFLLRLCAHRYLEDCGVINVMDYKYRQLSLDDSDNFRDQKQFPAWISKLWEQVADGVWTTELDSKRPPKLSDEFFPLAEKKLLLEQPKVKDLAEKVFETFYVNGRAIDCSDLNIEFFGTFYQVIENPQARNAAGRYFTSTDMARELSTFLSESFSRRDPLQKGEYILDPACGSGQLLRLLLPYAIDFVEHDRTRPTKLHQWREMASHLAGADIDENCTWITKVSLWLATAAKGHAFVEVKTVTKDVIEACLGVSPVGYARALGFQGREKVVAVISNPPWEEFRLQFPTFYKEKTGKNRPSQRNVKAWNEYEAWKTKHQGAFDKLVEARNHQNEILRQNFGITEIPNSSEIFFRICRGLLKSTTERGGRRSTLPYAVIMPDQYFIGTRMRLRDEVLPEMDFYIPFHRNIDPTTGSPYFFGVDPNRRFGIVLGKVNQNRRNRDVTARAIGVAPVQIPYHALGILPLPNDPAELLCLERLISNRDEKASIKWNEGEWHGTNWADRPGRSMSKQSNLRAFPVIKAEMLSTLYGLEFSKASQIIWWVESTNNDDRRLAANPRIIIGDTKRNSGKIVRAGFISGRNHTFDKSTCRNGVGLQNKLIYGDGDESWVPYLNSVYFELAVRPIAGASNLNAWRLNFLGCPKMPQGLLEEVASLSYARQQIVFGEALGFSPSQIRACIVACTWMTEADKKEALSLLTKTPNHKADRRNKGIQRSGR